MNLMEKVHKAILEDGVSDERQAARLAWEYEHSTEAEQRAIDRIFGLDHGIGHLVCMSPQKSERLTPHRG